MTGRTTLIIAHRLSTISLADRVAVVEGGQVIAEGTHAELLATEPRYAEILAQPSTSDDPTRTTGRRGRAAAIADRRGRPRSIAGRRRRWRRRRRWAARRTVRRWRAGGRAPHRAAAAPSRRGRQRACRSRASRRRCGQGVEKLLAERARRTPSPRSRSPSTHAREPAASPCGACCGRTGGRCSSSALLIVIETLVAPGRVRFLSRRSASTTASRAEDRSVLPPSSLAVHRRPSCFVTAVRVEPWRASATPGGSLVERVMFELRVRVVRAPPAPLARLLHRREGGRDHDPHDERHRVAPAAAPGRPRQARACRVCTLVVVTSCAVLYNAELALITLLRSSCRRMLAAVAVVPLGVRPRLPRACATASPAC